MATPSQEPGTDVSTELTEAVEGGQWREVLRLVHTDDCSHEQRHWAMERIVKEAPERFVGDRLDDICDNCGDDRLGSVLSHLLTRRLWRCVGHVLQHDISHTLHRWAVEEASRQADDVGFFSCILPHCHGEDLESVITHLVSRGLWLSVGGILERGVSCTQQKWAVEQASRQADDSSFSFFILPHCHDEDLESVVTHLVPRGLWQSVGQLLERGVSCTKHRWAVEQASRQADDDVFDHHILPHCHDEDLESVITHLVPRGLWQSVGKLLERGVSSTKHRWAVEQASRQADEHTFVYIILPHFHDEDLESIITHRVWQGQWWSVGEMLEKGVNSTLHRWAVEEALKRADEEEFAVHILPHCKEEELEQVLTHMVSRGLWEPVDSVTDSDVSVTQHILSQLMSHGLWEAVDSFMQRDLSSAVHRWAVEQASRRVDQREFIHHSVPHCPEEELEGMLKYMVSHDLWEPVDSVTDSNISVTQQVLLQLMSQGWWFAVRRFLQRGLKSAVHRWAVEQASTHADDDTFKRYILPLCHGQDLESVITHLLSRGLWRSVGEVLERGVRSTQHTWAVEQALKHADDWKFADYMLPHCKEEELEQVLTHMVSQGRWRSVGKALERGVHSTRRTWAVQQALMHSNEWKFTDYILPQCRDEELDQVLTHMVLRGLWEPADSVTDSEVSVTQHILSQLESHGLWNAVGRFLQRDLGHAVHRWAVEQASRHAGDDDFVNFIVPGCDDEDLEAVMVVLVSRGLCRSVDVGLKRGISSTRRRSALLQVTKHADDSSFHRYLLHHCSEDDVVALFPHLVANKMWRCTQCVLWAMVCDTLYTWMTSEHDSRTHDTLFWKFIHNCHVEVSLALGLTKAVTQILYLDWQKEHSSCVTCDIPRCVTWQRKALYNSLATLLLYLLCDVICSDDKEYTDSTEHTKQCVSDIYTHITACVKDNTHCLQDSILKTIQNKQKWTSVFTGLADLNYNDPLFLLHFLQGLNLYHINSQGENDDAILVVMLAIFPLFPQLQSVALRMMLREKRWDVISQACLSHVWEHDRRWLFKAAVMQRQWDVVRQWCDHTVHDDQRHWALTEAFKEKQWEVFLLLADHGLTPAEHMCVHYRLAKHAHWDTVLHMVERGGDITEVSDMLENWVTGNLRKKPEGDVTVYEERCLKLIRLRLRFAQKAARSPRKALERCLWGSVLFNILHEPTQHYFSQVLHKVIEEQEWHILMHLVRLGMTSADRDRLFPDMVRRQQWGVCAMLLECGVDDQLCLEALPELMERKQWTLVARVMEYDVEDAVRRQVMQWAFQWRAGALFWHCLTTMKDQEHLTKETQGKLFHQAIRRDIWQAVKPLLKEKDGPDIQRRDLAFLEAIEQHLWDVVDYCQPLGADINMEDENGETPLHREARKREWKAVEEIVLRDGQPNLLDKDGVSVLNRLIHHKQWDIVKVVIMYGGDIHLSARYSENWSWWDTHTPLQALITARQADVIHSTIRWCGDQDKGVNDKGERVLHAVCDSDRWDVMRDLIDIKVNPLAVTKTGKSPLVYAVLNTKCGKRMVAECSRQGFSSHQPSVTGPQDSLLEDVSNAAYVFSLSYMSPCDYIRWNTEITSPLVCAVLCDLPVETLMLYESGSCSNTELFTLYTQLPKLTDVNTEEGRRLHEKFRTEADSFQASHYMFERERADCLLHCYSRFTHTLKRYTPFLREVATTPRTLLSLCRLMISHSFHFSNKCRHKEMDQLPLPVSMKEYLMFSDLCDPDYGGHML